MYCKKLFAALLLLIPLMSSAQKMLTAEGDYTYYGPTNISPDQAKMIALERAKTQIIADHFGTVVGVNNSTFVQNGPESSSVSFLSLGESEVKGEWLETIGQPVFSMSFEENLQVVKVHVVGKIRELNVARTQLDAKILRNGIDDKYESDEFKAGDELFISFTSPIDGYLVIYLYDQYGVSRLLPVKSQKEGSVFVEANQRNVFFSRRANVYSVEENRYVERIFSEYEMTCSGEVEINRIYIVFSPNKFIRPLDDISEEQQELPANLSFEAFQKWLSKSRKQDMEMSVKIADIIVRNKNLF